MRPLSFFLTWLLLPCFMLLGGCYLLGLPDRNLREKLTEQDVHGTWKLTPASLQLLTRDGFKPDPGQLYTITFRPDGSCTVATVLDEFSGGKYLVTDGKWKLEHDTQGDSNVPKANALRLELNTEPGRSEIRYLNFDRDDKKRLVLWNFYGDPDSWEFMEYIRTSP